MDRILSSREQEVRAEGDQQSPMIEKDGKDGELFGFLGRASPGAWITGSDAAT